MPYMQYRGRVPGRVLYFLYEYAGDRISSTVVFEAPRTPGENYLTYYGQPFATYTWDGDGDVPTFTFLDVVGPSAAFLQNRQEQLKADAVAASEDWNSGPNCEKSH